MTHTLRPILILLALVTVLVVPVAAAAPAAAGSSPEVKVLQMVNAERGARGLHPFEMNRRLSHRAERNSCSMARHGRLSHSGHLRSGMAENVGVGTTLRSVVRAWMRSPEHRRNLLGPYRQAGVGVDKAAGLFWVTLTLR